MDDRKLFVYMTTNMIDGKNILDSTKAMNMMNI